MTEQAGPQLSDRERQVLEAVVRSYVETAEPAGSRTVARRYDLDYLISEESIDLPLARRFGRFAVYALHPNEIVAAPGMRPGGARPQDD